MMRKGRTIAIGLIFAVCGSADAAGAKSRFEARNEGPLVGVAELDFTIVIPEILTLRVSHNAIESDATKARMALTIPAMVAYFDADESKHALIPRAHATTNAGTLAFGTPVPTLGSGDDRAVTELQFPVSSTPADVEAPIEAAPTSISPNASPATLLIALP